MTLQNKTEESMLKFFRRIRQKLIKEGKLSKYVIYAAGEILLVMIGILLALQVNNWNLKRLETKNKEKLLHRIAIELQANIDRVNYLKAYEKSASFNDRQLKILKDGTLLDSIDVFFSRFPFPTNHPNLNASAYKEAQSTGALYGLDSDSLILKIENYYSLCDQQTYLFLYANNIVEKDIHTSPFNMAYREYSLRSKPYLIKHNEWLGDVNHIDYRKTMVIINQVKTANELWKNLLNTIAKESEELKLTINQELKK